MRGKRKRIRQALRRAKNPVNPKYLASCQGKIRHASYEEAKLACVDKPDHVKPYKCTFCIYYHIGRRYRA